MRPLGTLDDGKTQDNTMNAEKKSYVFNYLSTPLSLFSEIEERAGDYDDDNDDNDNDDDNHDDPRTLNI
ncbi:hypothetical protein RUND412_010934 [Rhizina undulata]